MSVGQDPGASEPIVIGSDVLAHQVRRMCVLGGLVGVGLSLPTPASTNLCLSTLQFAQLLLGNHFATTSNIRQPKSHGCNGTEIDGPKTGSFDL